MQLSLYLARVAPALRRGAFEKTRGGGAEVVRRGTGGAVRGWLDDYSLVQLTVAEILHRAAVSAAAVEPLAFADVQTCLLREGRRRS